MFDRSFVGAGMLEAMPDGLSQPYYRFEEPPCRHRFLDGRRHLHLIAVQVWPCDIGEVLTGLSETDNVAQVALLTKLSWIFCALQRHYAQDCCKLRGWSGWC